MPNDATSNDVEHSLVTNATSSRPSGPIAAAGSAVLHRSPELPSGENADHVEPASVDVYPFTLYPRSGFLGSSEFAAASRMRPVRSAAIET